MHIKYILILKKKSIGIFVCVDFIINKVNINHPHVAFTSANALWKALDFVPKEPIFYKAIEDTFIFPNSDIAVPDGRISKRELDKLIKKGDSK